MGREAWTEADCRDKAESAARYDKAPDTYATTDPGRAEFFHKVAGSEARYNLDRKRWHLFDDVRWNPDIQERVRLAVVDTLRAAQLAGAGNADRVKALIR